MTEHGPETAGPTRARLEGYVGEWLPEPLPDLGSGPAASGAPAGAPRAARPSGTPGRRKAGG